MASKLLKIAPLQIAHGMCLPASLTCACHTQPLAKQSTKACFSQMLQIPIVRWSCMIAILLPFAAISSIEPSGCCVPDLAISNSRWFGFTHGVKVTSTLCLHRVLSVDLLDKHCVSFVEAVLALHFLQRSMQPLTACCALHSCLYSVADLKWVISNPRQSKRCIVGHGELCGPDLASKYHDWLNLPVHQVKLLWYISTSSKPSVYQQQRLNYLSMILSCVVLPVVKIVQPPSACKICYLLQAGRGELLQRLHVQLSNWAPLLQRFLKSQDEQACNFAESDATNCCLVWSRSSI